MSASGSLPPWREVRPSRGRLFDLGLRELWDHRQLAVALAQRDVRLRYRQTFFGVAWAVLQPLLGMAIFSLVFGKLVGVESDGLPYPLFVLTGLVLWSFLSSAVLAAAESLVEHRDLVTKIWFPRMLAPLAAVLAAGIDLAISLLLLVPLMAAYGVGPGVQVLTLPVWVAGAFMLAGGAGLWLSAANVLYRDVRYAVGFLLQLWLFASPVVFPMSIVDESWRWVLALNPATLLIEGLRWALLDGPAPGDWAVVSVASLVLVLAGGAVVFRQAERGFADRI